MNKEYRIIYSLVGFILIIFLWHLIVEFKFVQPILLPYPRDVYNELFLLFKTSSFWNDVLSTISSWFFGLLIGCIVGIVVGILLSLNERVWFIFEPIVEFFRSLPSIVLVPLISLFVGVGLESKIISVSIVVAVTIISTIGIAMRSINITYIKLRHAWKLSTFDSINNIYFPEISSHLLIAIKTSIPLALIVSIAADMLIATENGIGKLITDSMAVFDSTKMYAAIIVVGILGYFSAKISNIIEVRFIHWKGK